MSSEPVPAAGNDLAAACVDATVKTLPAAQTKTKKAKVAAATIVAATQADEDDMSNWSGDHPYLSVLYKRLRSHRKKLEKIKALEHAQASEGKVLNAQQVALMSNKGTLTKLVAELEMLREQFVCVYKLEMQQLLEQQKEVREVQPTILTTQSVEQVDATQEGDEAVKPNDEVCVVDTKEGQNEENQSVDKEPVVVLNVVQPEPAVAHDAFVNVYELLKTLHVVNLHQALGKDVPMVLDFFSKVVLGNTRPPAELSYEENLLESLEEAKKYLTESDKVFACDTTYRDLRAFVDQLVTISSQASSGNSVAQSVDEVESFAAGVDEVPDVPVVPAEINTMPQISFFTDSQLESELANELGAENAVTDLHVDVTEAVAMEVGDEIATEVYHQNGVQTAQQGGVLVQPLSLAASIPAPPFSFAAVAAAGVSSPASLGPSDNDKKELGPGRSSLQGKSSRRRGQERWKEKDSNSTSGGNKSGNGSPTNGGKPRRSRAPRTIDEGGRAVQGGRRSGSKEDGRPRVFRGLRKQNDSPQPQHTGALIAPHA